MAINKKGILGEKLGMTQVWDENNRVVPVTVVKAGPCVVTQVRTPENDGYSGVQIAFGQIDPRKVTQPMLGHFAKAGVTPRRHLLELRFDDASDYALGQELGADTFEAGSNCREVTGRSTQPSRLGASLVGPHIEESFAAILGSISFNLEIKSE